ncbi:UNVERIFIED_CONTAM: hypothetical protein Slati_2686400 [Sesamum latifolium]|uniref:Uncharacterized protein n=1 Tax=Sesamum latifolium TaxID=2727402 RepID=A0AAW2VXA3_9LAMI
MVRHFEPTEAHALFHRINPLRLLNVHFHHQGPSLEADDANISNTFKDLFVALRSSYLTLQIRGDSIFEAYSPHRFSRQFGFCQDVPGSLKKEILTCSLKALGRLWQSCTLSGTSSKPLIPGSVSLSSLVTKEYADWWAKCNKTSLEKNTRVILKLNHPSNLEKGSKDNQAMPTIETDVAKPVTTTSNRRHNVLIDTPVIPLSGKNDVIPALSISNGQLSNPQSLEKVFDLAIISVNFSFFEGLPSSMGSVNRISEFDLPKVDAALNGELQPVSKDDHPSVETPSKRPKFVLLAIMEKLPLVEDVLEKLKKTFEAPFWPSSSVEEMDTYMKDTSPLESHLKVFFDGASNYKRTKLESSRKVTREVYKESPSLAENNLFAIEAKEKEHAKGVESLEAEILQVVNQQGVLKKQLEELKTKEELINSSLHGAKGALINFRKDVATKKEKV